MTKLWTIHIIEPVIKDQPYIITDEVSSCLMHIIWLIMKSLPITLVEAFLSDLKWPHWLVRVISLCLKLQTSCFQCLFLCSPLLCGNDDLAFSIRKRAYRWSRCRLSYLLTSWRAWWAASTATYLIQLQTTGKMSDIGVNKKTLILSGYREKEIMICLKLSSVSRNWPLF